MDIGAIIFIIIRDRMDDLPWFLSSGSIVKIEDGLIFDEPF